MKWTLPYRLVSVKDLTAAEIEAMWTLYSPHHVVDRDYFLQKLMKRLDLVGLYTAPSTDELVGIHGVGVKHYEEPGRRGKTLIYFGQSFTDERFRGRGFIPYVAITVWLRTKLSRPFFDHYIWYDAASYKPYLQMVNGTKRHYPSRDAETPPDIKRVLDFIGKTYYGDDYDCGTGRIRQHTWRLKAHTAPITDEDLARNPHLQFFTRASGGYQNGFGLLCLFPATLENLLAYVKSRCAKALTSRRTGRESIGQRNST
jgi:hypothetical protein